MTAKRPPPPRTLSKPTDENDPFGVWNYETIARLAKSQFTPRQIANYIGVDTDIFTDRLKVDPKLREVFYTSRLGVVDEVASAVIHCAIHEKDRDAQKILLRKAGWFNDVTKAKALQLRVKELELKNEELQLKYLALLTPEQIDEKARELLKEQEKLKDTH